MINHKHKFIFIHIPKTAGESIEVTFQAKGELKYWASFDHTNHEPLQHLTANEIKKRLGKSEYNKYYKFSFVRNPFSRCVSEYFWWRQKIDSDRRRCNSSFAQWVHEDLPSLISKNPSIKSLISSKTCNCPMDQPANLSLITSSIVILNSEKDEVVGIPVDPPIGTVNISPFPYPYPVFLIVKSITLDP